MAIHIKLRTKRKMPHVNFYLCREEELTALDRAFDVAISFPYTALPAKTRKTYEGCDILGEPFPGPGADINAGVWYMYVPVRLASTGIDRGEVFRRIRVFSRTSDDPRDLYGGQVPLEEVEGDDALSPLGYINSYYADPHRPPFGDSAVLRGRAMEYGPESLCALCPNVIERAAGECFPGCRKCKTNLARVEGHNFADHLRRAKSRELTPTPPSQEEP